MYKEQLKSLLKELIGKKCWSVIGPSVGSIFSLNFGKKIIISPALKNPHLTEEERNYEGEFSFLIYCSWRLDTNNCVLCGSEEDAESMTRNMNLLIGKTIEDIRISEPALDMEIIFSGGYSLKLFCVYTDPEIMDINYDLFFPIGSFTVGCKGEVSFEKHVFETVN